MSRLVCPQELVWHIYSDLSVHDTTTMGFKNSRSYLYLLVVVTLGAIAILLTLIVFQSHLYETFIHPICGNYAIVHESIDCTNDRSWEQPNGNYDGTSLFEPHPLLENISSAANKAWAHSQLPPNGGFLFVQLNDTSDRAWGISMFHALHCLQTLRKTIQKEEVDDPGHVGHCIGYIAQYLTCAADGTIEPPWVNYDDSGEIEAIGVDGMGYQHQCRDSGLLWDISTRSEDNAVERWDWRMGDTVESVFGS